MVGREQGRACKHLFKYMYPNPPFTPLTSWKSVSRVKISIVKCQKVRCRRVCLLCYSVPVKPNDYHKCWRMLSQLTNHRVYQELVHYSTSPQLAHAIFAQRSSFSRSQEQVIIMLLPLRTLCSQVKYMYSWPLKPMTVEEVVEGRTC